MRPSRSNTMLVKATASGSILAAFRTFTDRLRRGIFDQFDVPGFHGDLFSSGHFQLSPSAKRNHILAAGSVMPIAYPAGRCAMELSPGDAQHPKSVVGVAGGEFGLYFFGMRLAVLPSVEPRDKNGLVFFSTTHGATCLRRRYQNRQAQPTRADDPGDF